MRGYPKHINTRQDIENIKNNHPEFHEQLKKELDSILSEPETVTKVIGFVGMVGGGNTPENVNIQSEAVTERINNPAPRWKQLGFSNKGQVQSMRNSL